MGKTGASGLRSAWVWSTPEGMGPAKAFDEENRPVKGSVNPSMLPAPVPGCQQLCVGFLGGKGQWEVGRLL